MSAPHGDELVRDYLARLRSALAVLPADRREEIYGEVASHIEEQRAALNDESDADVYNLLERVGDPAVLAATASVDGDVGIDPSAPRPQRIGAVEILALVLTPLLWPVGVILLWLSPAWNVRDKLIGTLLPPGGYPALFLLALPALLLGSAETRSASCVTIRDAAGNLVSQTCNGAPPIPDWQQTLITVGVIGGAILLLVLPILVGIYLATRLNKARGVDRPA